eukprot:12455909-Alexandrium_andersonii.AAC.1
MSSGPAASRSRVSPSSSSGRTAGPPNLRSLTPGTCARERRSTPACPCSTGSSASVSGPSSRTRRSSRTSRGRSWQSSAP